MNILVINCGSSSIKAEVVDTESGARGLSLRVERVNEATPSYRFNDDPAQPSPHRGHRAVLDHVLPELAERLGDTPLAGTGHRVVHGGDRFDQAVRIDDGVCAAIEDLVPLAPLHNPANLAGIQAARAHFQELPHFAVFDTAFHATLPNRARHYALPRELMEKHRLKRYGFHGTSHAFVAQRAAEHLKTDVRSLRLITAHLGNGCSMAAVEFGRSVETSMGVTPLEGLVMGTRCGDLDPAILITLMRDEGMDADAIDRLLNRESGLKGMSGVSNDMRDLIARAAEGDEACRLAVQVFCHRVRKYIGAYAAVMDGVDAIVFTGGIGENSAVIRQHCTQRLDFLGALIDEDRNRDIALTRESPVADFSQAHSRTRLLAVATDEQLSIARQAAGLLDEADKVNPVPAIPIAISARHVHLTQETVEQLFGAGYQLTERNPLSQPGQFACNETVALVGPKNTIEKVRILGPTRSKNQVEISRTDEFFLGVDAPVRQSGHTEGSPGITLRGPAGTVTLPEGLICAWRHIHMTTAEAESFGVEQGDIVEVDVSTEERSLTFGNVLVRVKDSYALEMHIDTDEGNAAEIGREAKGTLASTTGEAHLKQRRLRG